MQVSVSGKQIDIGNSLQEYARDHLEKVVNKYFDRAISSEVKFSKQSHKHENHFQADIIVNEGAGIGVIKSSAISDNVYGAFDAALNKIEHRLSKYKSKIKNHHKPKMSEEIGYDNSKLLKGTKYVMTPFMVEVDKENDDNPVIIAEQHTSIESFTVGEAVMRMDLRDVPALLFRNKANGRLNVVYHRADGNISWVDPQESLDL
jgi:ribosomal subunit interface protein